MLVNNSDSDNQNSDFYEEIKNKQKDNIYVFSSLFFLKDWNCFDCIRRKLGDDSDKSYYKTFEQILLLFNSLLVKLVISF